MRSSAHLPSRSSSFVPRSSRHTLSRSCCGVGGVGRLLQCSRDGVLKRWHLGFLTAILELVSRRGGRVLLHNRLHAKYFRNEARVLLGSANLTGAALGWSAQSNLELLVDSRLNLVMSLEEQLERESIVATPELADELAALALTVAVPSAPPGPAEAAEMADDAVEWRDWWPALRHPSDLAYAYRHGTERLSSSASAAARADLAWLDAPGGLTDEGFHALVGGRLLEHPLISELDQFLLESPRFGAVREYVSARRELSREDAEVAWQTLMRWLLEFLPDRYRVSTPHVSEVIQRVTQKGRAT